MILRSILATLLISGGSDDTASDNGRFLYLSRQHYSCLVRNISVYQREERDPLVIDLRVCDKIVDGKLVRRPQLYPLRPARGRYRGAYVDPDNVIALTQDELACLRSRSKRRAIVRSVETGLYEIPLRFKC